MKRNRHLLVISLLLTFLLIATGCANDETKSETDDSKEVNLYTSRHYETDDVLFDKFTEDTGIDVNIIKGESDELIERISREGEATEADLFFTADAGRLHRAKTDDLLQSVESDTINENIPENLRDKDNQWFGLTKRARAIVYATDRVDPSELSTYEALTDEKWNEKVLIRSSSNIYNQSLLASLIELNGKEQAKVWAKGIVENMAREPQGGDRDQAKAIAAGIGDLAVINTYYFGNMLNSEDPEEVKVAENLSIFFPNQDTTGTHINVSGLGVTKHAKNKENAIKLIEFLSSEEAQGQFAETNYEYPVNPEVEPSELLKSWGEFKEQDINLTILGENNPDAVMIFNEVDWK
ncbi:iron deficiency-induced protein A [Paraliobacillus quinghaiensis]|uniref:Iron deficiency-induced protein A n=1 Tax=Paraliobacillus quinghaiensis TaxID=470815 RepID=A0A917WZ48_9BACI|nr:Fe(3+) ABC transporter substrate-binding protein [Paraliobacillus quinghaiensis]GGM42458.1 iron deficiency-induced protein A [Paraliobacillus quinghaiensis]